VQRLRFNDRPLIQIVYLPDKGGPVALCAIKDANPDQDVASQRVDDLNLVTWRRAGLAYALIANNDVDLSALGKQISNSSLSARPLASSPFLTNHLPGGCTAVDVVRNGLVR
jgi:hypothetical protein